MDQETREYSARDPIPDHEQKRVALSYLNEAWAEARHDGVDDDCMAQACLFAAFAEFVATYGEDAAAQYAETLAGKVPSSVPPLALLMKVLICAVVQPVGQTVRRLSEGILICWVTPSESTPSL